MARQQQDGEIVDQNYGQISSAALDPIEKKPLIDFYPGSMILSVGSYGCNLRCPFCQNHTISQHNLDERCELVTPQQLVEKAEELRPYGNIGIAFTYNEPLIGYEFVRDTAKIARERGLKTVVVTNGCVTDKVIDAVEPYIDAYNVDLKGFSQEYYDYVGGDFEMVLHFIERTSKKAHVEVTMLIVPGKNNSPEEVECTARWLAEHAPFATLHLTRAFSGWKETIEPASVEEMRMLEAAARKYLPKVALGNIQNQK